MLDPAQNICLSELKWAKTRSGLNINHVILRITKNYKQRNENFSGGLRVSLIQFYEFKSYLKINFQSLLFMLKSWNNPVPTSSASKMIIVAFLTVLTYLNKCSFLCTASVFPSTIAQVLLCVWEVCFSYSICGTLSQKHSSDIRLMNFKACPFFS